MFPATEKDTKKVIGFYQHHPVPGYEIGKVHMIYNKTFNHKFALELETLQEKQGNPAFKPKWEEMSEPKWRKETYNLYEKLAEPHTDPDYPNVKLIPAWHGTDSTILDSIFKIGYSNLATTDSGFFGAGLYSAHEAEYSHRVYSKGALILNWTASFSPLPVIDGDMNGLKGKGNYKNYDAHFVPVVPSNPNNPNEKVYYPCKPNQKNTYTEIVVFQTAACLPRFLVELQATNLKSPTLLIQQQPIQPQLPKQKPLNTIVPQQPSPQTFFKPAPEEKIVIEKKQNAHEKVTEQAKAIHHKINPQEVTALLKWVAEGHLEEAEKLLKKNPHLALGQGDVKDLSDRVFKNVTAFQLAVWYLDAEMWEIILKYLEKSQAASQFDALQNHRPDITKEYGKHFNFAPLLKAYQTYIDNYEPWTADQCRNHFIKVIGGEQRHVPAWYIYAFCEEGEKVMWQTLNINLKVTREYSKNQSTTMMLWYSDLRTYKRGVGISFGYCRGWGGTPFSDGCDSLIASHDDYVTKLVMSRQTEQLDKLQASLLESQTNEKRHTIVPQQPSPQTFFKPAPEEKIVIEKKQNAHEKVTEQANAISKQINPQEVTALLKWVAEGHLEEAEKLLKKNPHLALGQGDVKDLSDRVFKNVTAFQLAVWYLDAEMWEIILKYLEKSQAASQFDALQNHRPDITKEYGKHFNFAPLLKAYQTYIDNYDPWTADQCRNHFIKVIGGEQRHVPAWYIYAFCEEGEKVMWHTLNINLKVTREYSKNHSTSWNTAKYYGGICGNSFGYYRGRCTHLNFVGVFLPEWLAYVTQEMMHDLKVTQLVMSRQTEQLDKLQASLLESQTNEKRLEKGFKK